MVDETVPPGQYGVTGGGREWGETTGGSLGTCRVPPEPATPLPFPVLDVGKDRVRSSFEGQKEEVTSKP